jgi:hypothetical protein
MACSSVMSRWIAIAAALAAAVSCADEPRTVHETLVDIGYIAAIDAPPSAQAGSAFVVSITTVGDPCFSVYSTEVTETADGADITPYDQQIVSVAPNSACPASRIYLPHDAMLEFASPGPKIVTVHGAGGRADPVTIDVQ